MVILLKIKRRDFFSTRQHSYFQLVSRIVKTWKFKLLYFRNETCYGNGNLYKDFFFVYLQPSVNRNSWNLAILTLQFDDVTVKTIYCLEGANVQTMKIVRNISNSFNLPFGICFQALRPELFLVLFRQWPWVKRVGSLKPKAGRFDKLESFRYKSIRYKLKEWNCTKILFTSGVVVACEQEKHFGLISSFFN